MNTYKAKEISVMIGGEKVEGFTLDELTAGAELADPAPLAEPESIFKIVAKVALKLGLSPEQVLKDMNAAQALVDKREKIALHQAQRNEQTPNRKARRAARAR